MATTYYDTEDKLQVTSQSFPLKVNVGIGDGQGGAYLIFNGVNPVGINEEATIQSISNNEWITITATIKDKLTQTNWTSVTVVVKDKTGGEVKYGPYKREVEKHLDTVCYTIKLKMK